MRFVLSVLALTSFLRAVDKPADAPQVELAGPELAWALHRAASPDTGKNSFLSPYSLSACLGMAAQGAKGATLEEMRAALRHRLPADQQHAAFGAASRNLLADVRSAGQELEAANGICLVQGGVNRAYLADIRRDYDAEVFGGDVGAINAWASRKTRGMVPSILRELPANTVFVLLNAVYFRGKWEAPFDRKYTKEDTFRRGDGAEVTVDMMTQNRAMHYVRVGDFRRLTLPYGRSGDVAMEVLLPVEGRSLAEAEGALTPEGFARLLGALPRKVRVDLSLPRFRLEQSYRLREALESLGMRAAFGDAADFSVLSGLPAGIRIGLVVHRAVVEVDEEGTKAAAVSAVAGVMKSAKPQPREEEIFVADRPFLVVIRSGETILFIGRVADPTGMRLRR